MSRYSSKLLIGVVALIAMVAGFWLASFQKNTLDQGSGIEQGQGFHGARLTTPRQIAIPALVKHDGNVFSKEDLLGHWSLLFFGYTHCPDVCPSTMTTLAAAKRQSVTGFPQVFFISVDPDRDVPEILSDYVNYFDEDFTGVTGDEKMLQALALQASVLFVKVPSEPGSENEYLMDHSAALLVINPQGQLEAFINPPHTPDSILDSLKKLSVIG